MHGVNSVWFIYRMYHVQSNESVSRSLSPVWLFVTPWTVPHSPGKNTGVGCRFLLQGIFLTQGLNLGLLHCRWILYHLSHQGSPTSGYEVKIFDRVISENKSFFCQNFDSLWTDVKQKYGDTFMEDKEEWLCFFASQRRKTVGSHLKNCAHLPPSARE